MIKYVASPLSSPDPTLRLFWFHHAGGSALSYRSWARLFPRDWGLVFLEYPGRGGSAALPPARRMEPLADAVLDAIEPLLDRPYAFFGHSMGSLVAFATARRAMARDLPAPFWLGASGRHAPHLGARRYMIHKLSDDALTDVVRTIGGTPMDLLADPRDRARFLDLLRADFEACETYHPEPEPRLPLPITSYVGTEDPTVPLAEVRAWAQLTSSEFELRRFAGGHFYMTGAKAEVARHLIDDVREALLWSGPSSTTHWPQKTA